MSSSPRKRQKSEPKAKEPPNVDKLVAFLTKEEDVIREAAKDILNKDLIEHTESVSKLDKQAAELENFQQAVDSGFVKQLRAQLTSSYRMGIKLEAWVNSYTPPLASGGNVGISGEVQDGMFGNIHALSTGCSDALHRMLGFEKEYAVQMSKCTEETWKRYKVTLEASMLHDLSKTTLQLHADLLNAANSISNNLSHLRVGTDAPIAAMY